VASPLLLARSYHNWSCGEKQGSWESIREYMTPGNWFGYEELKYRAEKWLMRNEL
jgi:hypothetical protein